LSQSSPQLPSSSCWWPATTPTRALRAPVLLSIDSAGHEEASSSSAAGAPLVACLCPSRRRRLIASSSSGPNHQLRRPPNKGNKDKAASSSSSCAGAAAAGRRRRGGGEGAARVQAAELPRQVQRVQPLRGRAGAHSGYHHALQLQAHGVEVPVPRPPLPAQIHNPSIPMTTRSSCRRIYIRSCFFHVVSPPSSVDVHGGYIWSFLHFPFLPCCVASVSARRTPAMQASPATFIIFLLLACAGSFSSIRSFLVASRSSTYSVHCCSLLLVQESSGRLYRLCQLVLSIIMYVHVGG